MGSKRPSNNCLVHFYKRKMDPKRIEMEDVSDQPEPVVHSDDSEGEGDSKPVNKIKSYTDIMKLKLDKLMANPEKPVHIPERPNDRNVNKAPEFNHNIMGSSAGAGSGEFHLYRQMRRKEQNRQAILGYRARRDQLNAAFHEKMEENNKACEDKTAKKRQKRQKQKEKKKLKKKEGKVDEAKISKSESESDSEKEEEVVSKVEVKQDIPVKDDPLMREPPKKAPLVIHY